MAARYRIEEEDNVQKPTGTAPAPLYADDERRVKSDPVHLRTDPVLASLVDYEEAAA